MALTYIQFHATYTIPATLIFLILAFPFLTKILALKLLLLVIVAVSYTTPWDSFIISKNVWSYETNRVIFAINLIPIEEYFFFAIQSVFSVLFTFLVLKLSSPSIPHLSSPKPTWLKYPIRIIPLLIFSTGFVTGLWICFAGHKKNFYFGMILWWSCPILFIEWWYAGAYIFARIRLALSCILIPTIYLAYVDQIAIRDRIWVIEEPTCTGITMRVIGLGDLPVEEFFFFLVTNCMVVCGYFAFERGESVIRILMTEDGKRKRDDLYFDKTFDGEVATRSALSKKPNYQLVQYVVQSFSKSDSDLDQSLIKDFSVSYHALVEGSKSFSAALKVFPDHIHFDIIALYAFCRVSDDIADDDKRGLNERKELFRMLKIIVDDIWSEDMCLHEKVELSWSHLKSVVPMFGPVMRNLVRAGLYRKIPKDVIAELLSGYEWDLESKCIETNEDLILYANKVASSVGEAMLCLMINRADKDLQKSARDMGVALQLVNCARDIITDAKIGRCYVPTTLLESTFVPDLRKSLLHDPSSVPLTVYSHLALELIRESKPYQESAKEGISKLPRMYRRPIRSALRIYMGIGKEIENEYPGYVERSRTTAAWKILVLILEMYF